MAKFFIDRPIFAWVVALFIIVIGLVSYKQLPVAQYPTVAPPTISISAAYPGASAQVLEETVLAVIEREMNGSPGLVYMESTSQANGRGEITLSFEPGTNADLAQVDVQNRLTQATPRLPAAVTQQGIQVEKASSNFLMVVGLISTSDDVSVHDLSDYVSRNVMPTIQRTPGVGKAQMFAAERAMRIWIDPAKLTGFNLSAAEVTAAIAAQNAQVSAGSLGDLPNATGQTISATVVVDGQLTNVEQFQDIVLRANADGSVVRLKDVANVEMGIETYAFGSRLNGKPAVAIGVQLSNDGNALSTSQAVRERMAEQQAFFPKGVEWLVPYDTSKFIDISMEQVAHTLIEAIALVFVVMFLFLQNWRYTLIPTIVVPIALLGTLGVLYAAGFSLNVLSMFGMVLVIGIVVDDAIIVVENVERIMSEEGLSPLAASRKAMGQISGAIIGVTLVLIAVFVPLAFFGGSIGNIYRQFSITMVTSIAFSAFLALSLTPALCASFLKPVEAGHHMEKRGFFGWFNRSFTSTAKRYEGAMGGLVRHAWIMMGLYLAIGAAVALIYQRLPSSFLPNEDQGYVVNNVQLPPGATQQRTLEAIKAAEDFFSKQPEVQNVVSILGFSFSGQGQNAALQFVTLKDWDERKGAEHSASALAERAKGTLMQFRDAFMFTLSPPPIPALGNASGFDLRLQDRGAQGHDALVNARNMLLGMASQSKVLTGVRPDGLEDAPQLKLEIDRDKAQAMGVDFSTVNRALSTLLGSSYVNDFLSRGRLQRVMVQAVPEARMQPEDILALTVLNNAGVAVPMSSFATADWVSGPMQGVRYNGYPAMKITGDAAAGFSTGEAMAEMEKLVAQLPEGFGYEWTGQSREEKLAGSTGMVLYLFSILAVFLCLAALYESWSIPLAVILVVPLGVLGVVGAVALHSIPRDVYFQIGLVTIIGLSAKNAILIIEFAKDLQAQGMSAIEAALQAAHLRFRPILMTSLAFTFGVVPLYLASGASSASQRTIGTGVIGGMITGTIFALLFVPIFYVVVRKIFGNGKPREQDDASVALPTQEPVHHA
ncbi:efflux RND transporter permease subunit [Lampropedia puyangensis]|uniref:Efflux pump membrane transporter n=1 Tax=Lampropedia puyangensis TaxID=1330072 RepID=A0A4S8F5Y0_9BURK|nr:efflux RND transporter permease subunit [Lampropedia puyangensis]THU02519.1 efflux RND transporter permease subunit [Lampropedia puyangensis]